MDILELAYSLGEQKEWVHLHRMANWSGDRSGLPSETIEYFVKFSRALISERKKLRAENRKTFNSQIRDVAIKHLNLTKPSTGQTSLDDKSYADFFKSKTYKHARAVLKEVYNDPLLHESEAIQVVADKLKLDVHTVRRQWKDARKHPAFGIGPSLLPLSRQVAQMQYLAEIIAEYSKSFARFATLKVESTIPHAISKLRNLKAAHRKITITTNRPACDLKGVEHFVDKDGTNDSRAYFAEVLAQCVRLNDKSYTAEEFSGIMPSLLIFFGEQIVAQLERREPRKHWP